MEFEVINHGRAYLRERRLGPFNRLGWMLIKAAFGATLAFELGALFIR
jgi:hypothetical protein